MTSPPRLQALLRAKVTPEHALEFTTLLHSMWKNDTEHAHSLEFKYRTRLLGLLAHNKIPTADISAICLPLWNLGKHKRVQRWFA